MKKNILYSVLPLMAIIIFVAAQDFTTETTPATDEIELGWPDDVMALLENSCYDCHTKDASNIKSKGALNFSKWEDYKLTKKIGKLNDISESVKEKKMPPKKYLDKFPEKALSDEEIGVVTNWANAEAEKLMEE